VLALDVPVAERDWEPPPPRFGHEQIVGLRVAFAEVAVRDRVKQAGGTWNPERRVWQLLYDRVDALDLNRESPCRCRGAIQVKMLASTVRCGHLVADDGVAVQ